MCGIAGYVGRREGVGVVLEQLRRLEYRGYDSAGVAYQNGSGLRLLKRAGKLSALRELVESEGARTDDGALGDGAVGDGESGEGVVGAGGVGVSIAHSRWATHGAPTDLNAHPHLDQSGTVALVHNGIIENYLQLKEELVRSGHTFQSETDTEVAAHVIGREYGEGVALEEAVRRAARQMTGAYAFVVTSAREPGKIVCVRNSSPLVIGFGEGEAFLASDIPALLPFTRRVGLLENEQMAILTEGGVEVTTLDGKRSELPAQEVDWDVESAEKGGFEHFMLKEVTEQPDVVRQCLAGRIDGDRVSLSGLFSDHVWQEIDRVNIIACGTAYHAGLMGKTLFERMLQLPTDVYYSSEFRYGDPLLSQRSLAVFISQSGETADSLAALRLCRSRRIRTLGIVNVVGSSIAREVDRVVFTQAGPEISVASTKAYLAQVLSLYLVSLSIAQVKETPGVNVAKSVQALRTLPEAVQEALELGPQMEALAKRFQDSRLVFFLGRRADANVALEAALKLKEIAYIPTQECPAGEMKHGPLALIEEGTLAVFGATDPDVRDKLASNIKEVQARGGHVLAVTTRTDEHMAGVADTVARVAATGDSFLDALLSVVPLQLFAYHMARARGCEIDQPRNLAKSVTVE